MMNVNINAVKCCTNGKANVSSSYADDATLSVLNGQ